MHRSGRLITLGIALLAVPHLAPGATTTASTAAPALPPPPRLGIVVMDVSGLPDAKAQIAGFGGNLIVNEVFPKSQAEALGLRPGDAILRMNGQAVKTVADVLAAARPGPVLRVEVARDGRSVTLGR